MPKGHNVVDRVGQRYGRLVVLERSGSRGSSALWRCVCDCGAEAFVASTGLRSGTQSCGCSRRTGKGSRPSYTSTMEPGVSARNYALKQYRGSARSRGLEWGLSGAEFDSLAQGNCAYCGTPPSREIVVSRNGSYTCNGIDRLDNSIGYVTNNVVSCCSTCNHAKKDMHVDEFRRWIALLVANA